MSWFEELLKHCYGPLQLEPRAAVSAQQWNAVVDAHAQGSWWHRYEWLEYCLAYKGGTDYSFAAMSNGKIVALYPLIRERNTFALGGNPLVPALLTPGTTEELVSVSMHIGKNLVNIIARHHGIAYADMMLPPTANGPLEPGSVFEDSEEMESVSFSTRVVDLTIPKEERWKAVRKSYHQLIHRAEATSLVQWPGSGNAHRNMSQYIQLHRVANLRARSSETYNCQQGFLNTGHAVAYIADSLEHEPIGAVLWYIYKGMAYYASGVFTRDNLAHAALWHSMNDLAKNGVKYAELGWQGRATDKKGQAVEFFKRGFGGTDWPVPCSRRTFLTHKEAAS